LSADSGPHNSPRRFLLDQGFPKPVVAIEQLDRNVSYVHLSDMFPDFAATSTPDWMVLLLAAEQRFDGLVARDKKQLQTPESVAALALNPTLNFVTWRGPIEDPVAEWGQLMAYMPLVLRAIDQGRVGIFLLPKPTLETRSVVKARDWAGALASDSAISYPELLAEAHETMETELRNRRLLERLGALAGIR
jgi:hypothetical protein